MDELPSEFPTVAHAAADSAFRAARKDYDWSPDHPCRLTEDDASAARAAALDAARAVGLRDAPASLIPRIAETTAYNEIWDAAYEAASRRYIQHDE